MRAFKGVCSFLKLGLPVRWEPGWKTLLGACLALGLLGTAASDWLVRQQEQAWRDQLAQGVPVHVGPSGLDEHFLFGRIEEGSLAPDFTLPSRCQAQPVRLSALCREKPVVLIFGSLSCDLFCDRVPALDRLHRKYKSRAEFLWVYVSEAGHPIPGFEYVLEATRPAPHRPKGVAERPAFPGLNGPPEVGRCCRPDDSEPHLGAIRKALGEKHLILPWVIDRQDGAVEQAFRAWPLRLVLVGPGGRIARDLGHGFEGRWDLDEVERWVQAHSPA